MAAFGLVAGMILGTALSSAVTRIFFGNSKETEEDRNPNFGDSTALRMGVNSISSSSIRISNSPEINQAEHVNFLADILNRLWPYIAKAGADEIRAAVEPTFAETLPGPLKTLRFTKIDLGQIPIVMDNIIVHELKDGYVQFDLDVLWDSNSDIQLRADYIGSFGVKSIKLCGRMSFLLKPLSNVLPIVSAIQYCFINPPTLQLDFTGLANVADFSVIEKSIRGTLQKVIADLMVLPKRMLFKMDASCDLRTFYQRPIGIASVTCVRGRGFKVEKSTIGKGDIPDVYCSIKLGCEESWKTSVIKDSVSPEWNEMKDFILSDTDQIISVEAWDSDSGTFDSDDFLGSARVTVGDILLSGNVIEVELLKGGKTTGAFITVGCVIQRFINHAFTWKEEPKNENRIIGVLSVVVSRALNLPVEKKDASSSVKVTYGDSEHATGVVVDAPGCDACNPVYDCGFRFPIYLGATKEDRIKLCLSNNEKMLGEIEIQLDELKAAPNQTMMESRTVVDGASIEFSATLLGLPDSISGTSPDPVLQSPSSSLEDGTPTITPRESIKLSILNGHGFKSKKTRLMKVDIPDVYCVVKFGSSPNIWRTATIKDSVSPEWTNESSVYPLTSNNQSIVLEVFDANSRGKDDFYGTARVTVGKILLGGGTMELEIQKNGLGIGAYIVIKGEKV
jgi:Ca2+-dependent lipid-binding protein